MPIKESELKAILDAEKQDALAASSASKLSQERSDAIDYYMGDVSKDMPSADGRSKAVSTDVADTIEGLMPSLMEIFAGGDDVVAFEPVSQEDVEAAQQETEFVNYVFTQLNPGFIVLYSFIKDALLSKVGIVKVWWEKKETEERETYYDQPEDQYGLLATNPDVEVVEHSERPQPDGSILHDVTVVTKRDHSCARVEPVPPEEFGISRNAKNVQDATYCFHEVKRSEGDLIAEGYDAAQIKDLPSYAGLANEEEHTRDTVEESTKSDGDASLNKAMRLIRVTEHYIRMAYEEDEKPCLYRVTTGGEEGEVLKRNGKPDIEREEMVRFAAMTPVIITHRFFGRSIADLVMDIQRIKTALIRALLDNQYLANNPRTIVYENLASDNTLDDLLVSRPGGIVRAKAQGAVEVFKHPPISGEVLPVIEYMDATREWRTGVTRQGQGIDANALQNQSATAVNQAFTASQARMKLIARIFAETGVKDLFALLHATIRKYGKAEQTVKLRNKWVSIDPREWKTRHNMTINVGLGTGGKQEQLAGQMLLVQLQTQAVAAGKTNLVDDKQLFNSGRDLVKILGKRNVEEYFKDPSDPNNPPPQPQPDPKLIEIQMKADIEKLQAEADVAVNDRKVQADIALAEKKFEFEKELKLIEAQLSMRQSDQDMQLKQLDHENKKEERAAKAEEAKKPKASIEVKHGAEELTGPLGEAINAFGQQMQQQQQANAEMMAQVIAQASAPRRKRVKTPSGKSYEIEDVP